MSPTLDYASPQTPPPPSWVRRVWSGLGDRFCGLLEFLGFLLYLVLRLRRVSLAVGGALAGLGLGLCVTTNLHPHGPCVLSAGGAILGFFIPRTEK
jgi:hypothetical protein